MKNFGLFIIFIIQICVLNAFGEEIEIKAKVLTVNNDQGYFVFSAGSSQGVDIGDGLIVHRDNTKIAEAYVIEVRPEISAAEVLNIEGSYEIYEGDDVLLIKTKRPTVLTERKNLSYEISVSPEEIKKESDIVSTEIGRPVKEVFFYTIQLLQENGYNIISSNNATYSILAAKPIDLTILKELWADMLAAIDHNMVISIDIKGEGNASKISATAYKEHSQKNRYVKQAITKDGKNAKYYTELVDIVYKIKKRCED